MTTWFERDRQHVGLRFGQGLQHDTDPVEVADWWDEAVTEAVEDGFLDPRNWLGSAVEYAKECDLPGYRQALALLEEEE